MRQGNAEIKLPERKTDADINRIKKNINRVKVMTKIQYVGVTMAVPIPKR